MAGNLLNLVYIEICPSNLIDQLKSPIYLGNQAPAFKRIAAKVPTLWKVEIPLAAFQERKPVILSKVESMIQL